MNNYCACCGKVSNTSTDTCSAICASLLATRRAELHRFRDPATLRPIALDQLERAEQQPEVRELFFATDIPVLPDRSGELFFLAKQQADPPIPRKPLSLWGRLIEWFAK